jgi:hypothetical protein
VITRHEPPPAARRRARDWITIRPLTGEHRLLITRKGRHMHSEPRPRKHPKRTWLLAAVGACALIVAVTAVIAVNTPDRTARQRCEADVRTRLVAPTTAQLSEVQSTVSELDPDSRDLFPLTLNAPLKGIDHSRITVWNVTGVVNAQSEVGSTIHDPFICRAYFVDGSLADTLVVFDHDH